LSDAKREAIRKQLEIEIAAFRRLAKFSPYVAGVSFTQADLLLAAGIDYKPYMKLVGERASARKVVADRKAAQAKLQG
jgi:glutathione S-transferase